MTTNNLAASIDTRIKTIQASEKVTRVEMGHLSRELLLYVPDSKDIQRVNRLLSVLTFATRGYAVTFFKAFLPWQFDNNAMIFTKMLSGERRINDKFASITEFLNTPLVDDKGNKKDQDIWTWLETNVETEVRTVSMHYVDRIANLIKTATDKETEAVNPDGTPRRLTPAQVFNAILVGGMDLNEMLEFATEEASKRAKEAEKTSNILSENKVIEGKANKPANDTEKKGRKPKQLAVA